MPKGVRGRCSFQCSGPFSTETVMLARQHTWFSDLEHVVADSQQWGGSRNEGSLTPHSSPITHHPSPLTPHPSSLTPHSTRLSRSCRVRAVTACSPVAVPCGWGGPFPPLSADSWEGNTWLLEGHSEGERRALFPRAGSLHSGWEAWDQDKMPVTAA